MLFDVCGAMVLFPCSKFANCSVTSSSMVTSFENGPWKSTFEVGIFIVVVSPFPSKFLSITLLVEWHLSCVCVRDETGVVVDV